MSNRAAIAVGAAPVLILLGLTLVVCGLIEPDTGLAVFVTCTAWIVFALYRYQESMDDAPGPLSGGLSAAAAVHAGCDNPLASTVLEPPSTANEH